MFTYSDKRESLEGFITYCIEHEKEYTEGQYLWYRIKHGYVFKDLYTDLLRSVYRMF